MGLEVDGAPAYAGVDTHKDTHTLALLDALGRELGTWRFPATPEGYGELVRRIGDPSVPVAVEGTCSYGAGLCAALRAAGHEVLEALRPRRERRRRGKSDPIDALAAARDLAAGRCLAAKDLSGAAGELRWLMVAREQAVRHMTALSNCVDQMITTGPEAIRRAWPRGGAARMEGLAALEGGGAEGAALRAMAASWAAERDSAEELLGMIAAAVSAAFPLLVGAPCVGPVTAARLVVAAGSNPSRLRSEAAFSMLCGTSPVPASSGRTDRHRLNRGGDRQANRAIHEVARARMSRDARTAEYVARRVSGGKTKKEAIRCLCRYVAREVYGLLTSPQVPPCDQSALAARRRALGATQARAALGSGLTVSKVGRLERMQEFDTAALAAYGDWLSEQEGKALPTLDKL